MKDCLLLLAELYTPFDICVNIEETCAKSLFAISARVQFRPEYFRSQVEILLRSCKILQESCKILIKIKILIRSCLTFKILKNLSKNLVRS